MATTATSWACRCRCSGGCSRSWRSQSSSSGGQASVDDMSLKSLALSDELHAYLVGHTAPLDEIAKQLAEETRSTYPNLASMQIAPEQAAFLTLLTKLVGASQ